MGNEIYGNGYNNGNYYPQNNPQGYGNAGQPGYYNSPQGYGNNVQPGYYGNQQGYGCQMPQYQSDGGYTNPEEDNGDDGKSKKKWIIILSVILAVMIAVTVILILHFHKKVTAQDAYRDLLTDLYDDPSDFFSQISELDRYDVSDVNISEDEFSIIDTDEDSVPELIINITSPGEDNSFALVYDYTEDDGAQLRGVMSSDPEFYTDNTVVMTSRNEGTEISTIEKFDSDTREYTPVISYYGPDGSGSYSVEEYADGSWGEPVEYTADDFGRLIDGLLGQLEKLIADYQKITSSNIENISYDGTSEVHSKVVTLTETTEESTSTAEESTSIEDKYRYMTADQDVVEEFLNECDRSEFDSSNFDTNVPVPDKAAEIMEEYYEYLHTRTDYDFSNSYFAYVGKLGSQYDGGNGTGVYAFIDIDDTSYFYHVYVDEHFIYIGQLGSEVYGVWANGHPADYWEDAAVNFVKTNYPQYKDSYIEASIWNDGISIYIEYNNSNIQYSLDYDFTNFVREEY